MSEHLPTDSDLEDKTHSFIIRIWLEEDSQLKWRGHIIHVLEGRGRYLKKVEEITDFINPYLSEMGVRLNPFWGIRQWLKR